MAENWKVVMLVMMMRCTARRQVSDDLSLSCCCGMTLRWFSVAFLMFLVGISQPDPLANPSPGEARLLFLRHGRGGFFQILVIAGSCCQCDFVTSVLAQNKTKQYKTKQAVLWRWSIYTDLLDVNYVHWFTGPLSATKAYRHRDSMNTSHKRPLSQFLTPQS